MNAFSSYLEKHLHKQLLRYAAGHYIFCPVCLEILDCRRTVTAELIVKVSGFKDSNTSLTRCDKCWDRTWKAGLDRVIARVKEKHPTAECTLEVIDGREVFKRAPRAKKAPRAQPQPTPA